MGPTGPPANSGALNFPTDSEEHPRKADSFIAGAPTHAPIPMVYSCLMPSEKAWQRVEVSCKETPSAEQTHKLAEAMMEFTLDLFAQVLQKSTSPNVVLSPLSVALALYHLELGNWAHPLLPRGQNLEMGELGGTIGISRSSSLLLQSRKLEGPGVSRPRSHSEDRNRTLSPVW